MKDILDQTAKNIKIIDAGISWVTGTIAPDLPPEWYCRTRDDFQSRLQTFLSRMERKIGENAYLLTAVAGEIGNNSFDHNLGNWPDVPGIFFSCDEEHKVIVLVDRGNGVLFTIKRVVPTIKSDREALRLAFTKKISGRFPEQRGNGLKFVASTVGEKQWKLSFQSGSAMVSILPDYPLQVESSKINLSGCCAILWY